MLASGCDISKDAIRLAAKRYPAAFFLVANLKERLPFQDHALSVLLNIFAPRNIAEYARILAPGGISIVVIPGVRHLQPLRDTLHLLSIEENKQQHVIEQFSTHFTLQAAHSLTYELTLQHEEIVQLVMMTPNYWHLSNEQHLQMANLSTLTTTIDFTCLVFQTFGK
jgi:23S rRNA (guanine745-N1)-methyltransferase